MIDYSTDDNPNFVGYFDDNCDKETMEKFKKDLESLGYILYAGLIFKSEDN